MPSRRAVMNRRPGSRRFAQRSDARPRAALASRPAARAAQAGPRLHAEPDRRDDELYLVDQQYCLEQGGSAAASGERVELIMINRTGMPHPMHLHGHQFQVVEIDGKRFRGAMRDTFLVQPGRRVVVSFEADNPGLWAFHCHLLYHLPAGMFTTFRYV